MKNFNIMQVLWKIWFLRGKGGRHKKPRYWRELPKKKGGGGGLGKKRGEWVDTPMHTMGN